MQDAQDDSAILGDAIENQVATEDDATNRYAIDSESDRGILKATGAASGVVAMVSQRSRTS
ncbi:MAG: hypothetical protein RIC87_16505 [Kiloniellales bacterium]